MFQASPGGGLMPFWGKDGKHLYYLDPWQTLIAVDIVLGKDLVRVGKPVPRFEARVRMSIGGGGYDVTRDGRFRVVNSTTESATLLTRSPTGMPVEEITAIGSIFSELASRLPCETGNVRAVSSGHDLDL